MPLHWTQNSFRLVFQPLRYVNGAFLFHPYCIYIEMITIIRLMQMKSNKLADYITSSTWHWCTIIDNYRQVSNIRRTLVANKIVDLEHRLSALLQLHLQSRLNTWLQWIEQRQLQDEIRNIEVWGFSASYIRDCTVCTTRKLGWI